MASTRRTGLRLAVAAHQWFVDRVRSAGTTDRGDVPGWVLVTLMTGSRLTSRARCAPAGQFRPTPWRVLDT